MARKKSLNAVLDELTTEVGERVDENKEVAQFIDKETVQEEVNKSSLNSYIYEDRDLPLPGKKGAMEESFSRITESSKQIAQEGLVKSAAILKARKEAEERKARGILTKEEKMRQREEVCRELLRQAEEAYFVEHHYIMDGTTKRRTRKMIERNYDKGRYTKRSDKGNKGKVNLNE